MDAPRTDKEQVIVAFDGSPAARAAVVDAARILGACRVLVVTVWEEGLAYAASMDVAPASPDAIISAPAVEPDVAREVDREVHDHARRVSSEGAALATSLGLDAEPLAVPDAGTIWRTILEVAGEHEAAAIVVGSRGLGGIRARLEGSTSKALLRHARCPVIVVHESHEEHS
jgi:nucleotide-binding universal stress UspA family protein